MLRKFLLVGLGGSGGKTLRYVKQALGEWFRQVGWEGKMPQGWQFLHIDTPPNQDSPVIAGNPELLDADEYLSLNPPGVEFETIVEVLKDRGIDLRGWQVDPVIMNIPIDMGAGQFRSIGRMLGLHQINEVKQHLNRKRAAIMTAGAAAQLRELTEKIDEGMGGAESPPPIVIVVSSLAGGTGAGILIDVCDVLRSDGERWLDNSVGILYSADVFNELSFSAAQGVQPNSAAAYSEILHGYFGGNGFNPPGGGPIQQRSGPAFPYLVGQSNARGVNFGDQIEIYRFMGRCLAAVMSDPTIQDHFATYMMANWQASAGQFKQADPSDPVSLLAEPPSYVGAFQALGFAEVELGAKRLEMYAERRLTRDAVEWILSGHRRLSDERHEHRNLSEEDRIEKLAEESFTRFLEQCEINERGPDNNQIIDAIGLPESRLNAELSAVFRSIQEALGQRSDKEKPQEWIYSIVEEVKARRRGILQKWDTELRNSVAEWARKAQPRIVARVGTFVAERGARVTARLLDLAEREMEDVAKELEEESHGEDQLSQHLRSDVGSILSGGGVLRFDHPDVSKAISTALNTGVVRRYQGIVRLLASQLVEDFHRDFLAPLRRELQDAADKLADDIENERTPVAGWPRHEPESDQNVPDSLIPGQSVKTLIDLEQYPRLFDELTAATLGSGAGGSLDQQSSVRRAIILGEPQAPTPAGWLQETQRWRTRETLVLGEGPRNSAAFRIAVGRDDILARAREWLHTDGSAWDGFLSQGLRSYLSESKTVSQTELARRGDRFRHQLEAAFEAAEPLASVDESILARVHPATEMAIRPVPGKIPIRGLALEDQVTEFLTARFDRDRDTAVRCLSQDEKLNKIPVYCSLNSALHPIVFDSLMSPIADKYRWARDNGMIQNFWKWRRTRPLQVAAPLPAPTLLAMLRGWFTGRLLGTIDTESRPILLHSHRGVLKLPDLLGVGGGRSPDVLAELIEGLAIALPIAATWRDFGSYLGPYQQLVEWGREPGTAGHSLSQYRRPSQMLSEWLRTGKTVAGRIARVTGVDEATRLLDETARAYHGLYETDLETQTSQHSWLGLHDQIIKSLTQLKDCLSDQKTLPPTLL